VEGNTPSQFDQKDLFTKTGSVETPEQKRRSCLIVNFCRTITADEPGAIEWSDWSARSATCPGHPEQNISWTNSPAKQVVTWEIFYPEEQQANDEKAEDVDEEEAK
jgi:hypothetical protein